MILFKRAVFVCSAMLLVSACNDSRNQSVSIEDLQHHNWEVVNVDGMALSPNQDNRLPNIEFGENFTVNGFSGCNSYFGQGELNENQLRVGNMGQTKKMCAPNEMKVEDAITITLVDWSTITMSGSDITLEGKQHKLTLKLKDWMN